jgi:hypothetical protein
MLYDTIYHLCCFPFLGVLLADYLLKQLKKWAYKDERAFAKAGKEVKYEESCLCGSYSHNGRLSRKPIIQ